MCMLKTISCILFCNPFESIQKLRLCTGTARSLLMSQNNTKVLSRVNGNAHNLCYGADSVGTTFSNIEKSSLITVKISSINHEIFLNLLNML